jgi:RNA polymerase sigma-70 factor (ECF subfamily)
MAWDETELVKQAVAGDVEATSALLEYHGAAIESALRISRTWQGVLEPSDVMQVTFLEAFLRIGTFDPDRPEPFGIWLKRIAENNLRDAIRGLERNKRPHPRNRVTAPGSTDSMMELCDYLGATSTTPSRIAHRDEARHLLASAIEALPDDYRDAVRMYDLDGHAIEEVAGRMNRSTGAVHMLRSRGHDRLREKLRSASLFL